jgi:hypothetical protein
VRAAVVCAQVHTTGTQGFVSSLSTARHAHGTHA